MSGNKDKKTLFQKVQDALNEISRFVGTRQNQLMAFLMLIIIICACFVIQKKVQYNRAKETMSGQVQQEQPVPTESPEPTATAVPEVTARPEAGIYTYLQGPKSWGKRLAWSGEWGEKIYDGNSFGGFGCGLCCMANVYCSQTKYKCTPVDMYRYTKKTTDYYGGGAIEWGYMRQTLSSLGFDCRVRKKPAAYEEFKKQIEAGECAIVLVCSGDSTCYWKDTPGHYVTIFLYDKEGDRVFLADSGDPEHNRHWVKLKKIYRSLKTASSWQYLTVASYDEEQDQWKHKTVKGNWVQADAGTE